MKYEDVKSPDELLKFMDDNITYGFVGKNGKQYTDPFSKEWKKDWYNECIIQSGKEVLNTKIGTCWDQVELERLWFKKNNYQFKTIFIWFEVREINNLPTHTFLVYQKDNQYYWFEHAFDANKGIHKFVTLKDAIEYIKKRQLEYTISSGKAKDDSYDFIKSYEYDEPLPNLSVDAYINHVTSKSIEL